MILSYNHIELFAGCGGLSLGMHKAGFQLLLANEISPMASESFAFNFFGEDFEALAEEKHLPEKTIWLTSQFPDLKKRLRENPFEYPEITSNQSFSDLPVNGSELAGKLLVGSIVTLNQIIEGNIDYQNAISSGFGTGGVDLVSGGPPCQSFSMAGMRQKDCDKNTLPWEFAQFVSLSKPKIALLENVTGILRAFKDDDGKQYHAWFEVAKVFASIGYVPLCLHINARMVGIAQNRPRFIMIAVRKDVCDVLVRSFNAGCIDAQLFDKPLSFYQSVQNNLNDLEAIKFGSLPYYDALPSKNYELFKASSFLSELVKVEFSNGVSVRDALDDIKEKKPKPKSEFLKNLNQTFINVTKGNNQGLANHDFRSNSRIVQCRFRIYQVLQQINDKDITKNVLSVMKGGAHSLSDASWSAVREYHFASESVGWVTFSNKLKFETYLKYFPTKKQTQKALDPNAPAPAALSVPDDACHYDEDELRVLTVREMARIQSFPDNFVFRSKVTTGGKMRRFEVPQYTQVGNAVPPLLGLALGKSVSLLLDRYNKQLSIENAS